MKIVSMGKDFVLYRCLHAGLLSLANIEQKSTNMPNLPKEQIDRNKLFLTRLIETYGTCAMLAMDGEYAVAHVRFYPEVIYNHIERKHICCQDLAFAVTNKMTEIEMPSVDKLDDRTLYINCWFIHRDYRNRGLSHLLIEGIIEWASDHKWTTIQSCAAADNFWLASQVCTPMVHTYEKHGFKKIRIDPSPDIRDYLTQIRQGKMGPKRQQEFEKHCGDMNLSEMAVYHVVEHTMR